MNEEIPNESRDPVENKTGLTFADLPLAPAMREAIEAIGYETPSPIQAQAIPHLSEGRDLLGVAQTGTGKTAAFALPLLSRLDLKVNKPQILCLAPTRELAIQVAEAIESFGQRMKGLRVLPIYGGTQYHGQFRDLKRGVHVVVGTPGRIMDHMKRGSLNLESLQALVLDEADEMLSMGFIEDIEWVLEQTPETRQTALFSATMPKPIRKLSEQYMRDPVEVTIRLQATTSPNIRQRFLKRRRNEKLETLIGILEVEDFDALMAGHDHLAKGGREHAWYWWNVMPDKDMEPGIRTPDFENDDKSFLKWKIDTTITDSYGKKGNRELSHNFVQAPRPGSTT